MNSDALPPYWINHVSFVLRREAAQGFAAEGHDITAEEWAVLLILQADPGLTATALSEKSYRDKTTVTRMIDRLVRKSMVERRADPKDRRAQRLFLTRHGYETFAQLAQIAGALTERSLAGIAAERVADAVEVLAQMAANLRGDPAINRSCRRDPSRPRGGA